MLNPTTPFRIAFGERNLRLLLTGLAASQAGDWLYNLALLAFVYDRTHSSMWVGATTAARILPEVILGPLAGVLADRLDRRVVMLGADFARALTMGLLAAVVILNAPIVLAPVLAALSTAAGSPYPQCVVAVLPSLATDEQLPAANAARVSVMSICIVAGPLFGAVLLLLGSPAIAFALNGGTFLAGAVMVASLPRRALTAASVAGPAERPGLADELRAGWLALRDYRDAFPVVGANLIASAVYGAMTVLFVILGHRLGLGAAGYGYLLAGMGAGGVLAAGLAGRGADSDRPRQVLSLAVLAVGAPLPLLALSGWLPAALVLAGIFGAGATVTEVIGDTCLQRSLDPSVFGRAYGLVVPLCVGGIAVGALLAPVMVSYFGVTGALSLIGSAVVAYGLLLARAPRPVLAAATN